MTVTPAILADRIRHTCRGSHHATDALAIALRPHLDSVLREALDQIMILVDRPDMEREDIMGAADELSKVAQRIFSEAEGC